MKSLVMSLPYPPTMNTYWRNVRGRTLLSAAGRAYKAVVAAKVLMLGTRQPMRGRIVLIIVAFPPDRRRRDLDNLLKPIGDALAGANVFADDEQIDDLRIVRGPVQTGGAITVTITELEGNGQ